MQTSVPPSPASAWRLQDAKAQFSAVVDNAMRGVPQHVTRSGKRAVVVLSEEDFEALQRSAASRAHAPVSLIEHLLAMPKAPPGEQADPTRLEVQPRTVDLS
jgi:prevent-host-death family protein